MTGPATRRIGSLRLMDPGTRSPYFDHGPNPSRTSRTSRKHDSHAPYPGNGADERLDAQSRHRPSTSEPRASHHFSPSQASISTGLLRPCQIGSAALTSLQDPVRYSLRAALETHRSLSRDAAYCNFYDTFMQSFNSLYRAKPILIQGMLVESYIYGGLHSHAAQSMWPTTPGSC